MNQLFIKKKNELNQKKKKGFTLIELIIVIAVIAVLAAIAVPKFGKIKQDSNIAADQANAKIIATAVSSAIANGADINSGEVTNDVYVQYLDGRKMPKPKTVNATGYSVSYDPGTGVTVTLAHTKELPNGVDEQVYPIGESVSTT